MNHPEHNTVTTAYREGFQYTDGNLEFFPHQEGYVKVNASSIASFYTYVFNYTDHLGNIRLRYTQHPQTGETQILEEDHYYPFGLKHQGYNQEHFIIGFDQHGTHIDLIEITRDAQDTYRYKFGGKEYQNDFDVNLYDFGARNYDAALGRWMNIDPLAEMMRRHSPYNYAFNNPVFFIDPDGMSPLVSMAAMQTGAVEFYDFTGSSSGFDVRTYDKDTKKTLDFQSVSSLDGVSYNSKSGAISTNNSAAYKDFFQQAGDQAANAEVSLDGGKCPDGDCGGKVLRQQKESSYFKKALAVSAVLLADDVTGIGIVDDIAIPFILIGGLILDNTVGSGNENYPGPWTETQPDPGKFPYSPGFRGGDNKNFFPEGNGNPYTKWIIRIGGSAALGKKFYEGIRPQQVKDNTNIKKPIYYIPAP